MKSIVFAAFLIHGVFVSIAAAQASGMEGDEGGIELDFGTLDHAAYRALADTQLPVFTSGMLAAPAGADWITGMPLSRLGLAVADVVPAVVHTSGPFTVATDAAMNAVMQIDSEQGRVRYANMARQFNYATSSHTAVPESLALSMVLDMADDLEVPSSEFEDATGGCNDCQVATVMGQDYDDADQTGTPFSSLEAERMVTVGRFVNGFPVFDSMLRASVSNDGQIARVLARWTRFQLTAGLVMRTRGDVLDDIADGLLQSQQGVTPDALNIRVGYTRVGSSYIPVAEVAVINPVSASGFMVPLVGIGADADLDGVADAVDNCPNTSNPPNLSPVDCNMDTDFVDPGEPTGSQCDRDGDGVGDECDNCIDTVNATQADADENGIGDACEVAEGVCIFPDGDCQTITEATCTAEGGTYYGDGTACNGGVGIPTMTEWGAAVMAMFLVSAAMIVFARRRRVAA
jgi:hypothetical protein